jgi:DNA mismatch repair protein MutS
MALSQKLIDRYCELKKQVPDCLLLMQVGTFFQITNEDARIASQVTGLKLQMAGDIDNPVVSGGFPVIGLDKYLGKLVRAGHSIAIAWQNEDKQRHIKEIIRVHIEKL